MKCANPSAAQRAFHPTARAKAARISKAPDNTAKGVSAGSPMLAMYPAVPAMSVSFSNPDKRNTSDSMTRPVRSSGDLKTSIKAHSEVKKM
ncbi:hypothetical protein D3C84_942040 [compost metagenome]